MGTEALEQAFASTRAILAKVEPGQLDLPTPCVSWKVRDVINHIVGGSYWFAASAETGKGAELGSEDYTAIDAVAAYDEGIKRTVAAFQEPGTLDKVIDLPFGQFPGIAFMGLATTDTFAHGWDLAKATGQSTDIEPELAAQLLEGAKASIPDQFRGPDGKAPFGPKVEVPDSAPAADRLAGFLGRNV